MKARKVNPEKKPDKASKAKTLAMKRRMTRLRSSMRINKPSYLYRQNKYFPAFKDAAIEKHFCTQFADYYPHKNIKILGSLFTLAYFVYTVSVSTNSNSSLSLQVITIVLAFCSSCFFVLAITEKGVMKRLEFGAVLLPFPLMIWALKTMEEVQEINELILIFGLTAKLFSFSFIKSKSFFGFSMLALFSYIVIHLIIDSAHHLTFSILLRALIWIFITYNILYQNYLRRKIWGQLRLSGIENPFTEKKNSFKLKSLVSFAMKKQRKTIAKQLPENTYDRSLKSQLQSIEDNPLCKSFLVDLTRLHKIEVIGRGATCEVYETLYLDSHVAFKIINLNNANVNLEEEFMHELKITGECRHPNVVQLLGIVCSPAESLLGFILEFMPKGSLRDVLENEVENEELAWLDPKSKFAIDVCKGMIFLHEKKLIHRDLKTENVLVSQSLTCKISDLATAKRLSGTERCTTIIGTPFWRAPEMFRKESYDEKIDVFSFSIILLELQIQQNPFHDMNSADQLEYPHLVKKKGFSLPIPVDTPKQISTLINRCGRLESYMRPSFNTIRREIQSFITSLEGFGDNREKALKELGKLMFDQVIVSQQYIRHEYEPNDIIIEIDSYGHECFIVLHGIVEILVPIKAKEPLRRKTSSFKRAMRKLSINSWTINNEILQILDDLIETLENEKAFADMKFISVGQVLKYDYFGEMALVASSKRAARCIAKTKVTCISFTEEVFNSVFDDELRMLLASNILVKLSGNKNQKEIDSKYQSKRHDIFLKAQNMASGKQKGLP